MRWDEKAWDQTIRGFCRKLVDIRRSRRELREGKLLLLDEYLDGDALASCATWTCRTRRA
jgi:hypothetical protein